MRKRKSKHRLWSDIEVFPQTAQCKQCGSVSWLYSHDVVKNGEEISLIERWRCMSSKDHVSSIFVDQKQGT